MGSVTPKFIADGMLGRLAKWLRLLGIDTVYDPRLSDCSLVRCALAEDRILLTRDTQLLRRRLPPRRLYIEHDDFRAQLQQVLHAFAIEPGAHLLARCARCNAALVATAKPAVRDRVPPYVFQTQSHFASCPQCHRIYWAATHVQRIKAELQRLHGAP